MNHVLNARENIATKYFELNILLSILAAASVNIVPDRQKRSLV